MNARSVTDVRREMRMSLLYERILETMSLILLIATLVCSLVVVTYVFYDFFADIFEDIKRRRVKKEEK